MENLLFIFCIVLYFCHLNVKCSKIFLPPAKVSWKQKKKKKKLSARKKSLYRHPLNTKTHNKTATLFLRASNYHFLSTLWPQLNKAAWLHQLKTL